jgi:hypothetical protein
MLSSGKAGIAPTLSVLDLLRKRVFLLESEPLAIPRPNKLLSEMTTLKAM